MSLRARGGRVVEAWVRFYTLALPGEIRVRRQDELRSDVWEDLARGATERDLIRRMVAGAPADLAWRWNQGFVPPWIRLGARLAATALLLFALAVFDHDFVRAETVIGTSMYVSSFLLSAVAALAAGVGAWRHFRS